MSLVPPIMVALICMILPLRAHAYLDPGTGSAVIQMVVAGVMGALFVVKLYWRKLVAIFTGGDIAAAPEVKADRATDAAGAAGAAEQPHARDERS